MVGHWAASILIATALAAGCGDSPFFPSPGPALADDEHQVDNCIPTFELVDSPRYPNSFPDAWDDAQGTIDTGTDARCQTAASPLYDPCTIVASRVIIAAGATLRVTGKRRLVVLTTGDIVIDGVFDASGTDGSSTRVPGPGWDQCQGGDGQAGAGGGHVDVGGSAGSAMGGANLDLGLCAGGKGGFGTGITERGLGGGAVALISLCGAIRINGTVDASGGGGAAATVSGATPCCSGAGGGAGGTIWLQAHSILFGAAAKLDVAGGGGAGGGCRVSGSTTGLAGVGASRSTPGGGATCSDGSQGGDGGSGGTGTLAPGNGKAGTPASGGYGGLGGGGGSRGRVAIETETDLCGAAPHTGECIFRKLGSVDH